MGGKKICFELFLTPVSTECKVNYDHPTQPGRGKGNIMNIRTKIDPTDSSLMDLLQRLPLNVRMCMMKSFKDENIYNLCSQIGLVVRIIGNSVDRAYELTDENVLETLNMVVKFRNKVKVSFRGVTDKSEVEKIINKQLLLHPTLNRDLLISFDDDMFVVTKRSS